MHLYLYDNGYFSWPLLLKFKYEEKCVYKCDFSKQLDLVLIGKWHSRLLQLSLKGVLLHCKSWKLKTPVLKFL